MECHGRGIGRWEWCFQGHPIALIFKRSSCSSRQYLKTASDRGECAWDSVVQTVNKVLSCLGNQVERGTGFLLTAMTFKRTVCGFPIVFESWLINDRLVGGKLFRKLHLHGICAAAAQLSETPSSRGTSHQWCLETPHSWKVLTAAQPWSYNHRCTIYCWVVGFPRRSRSGLPTSYASKKCAELSPLQLPTPVSRRIEGVLSPTERLHKLERWARTTIILSRFCCAGFDGWCQGGYSRR